MRTCLLFVLSLVTACDIGVPTPKVLLPDAGIERAGMAVSDAAAAADSRDAGAAVDPGRARDAATLTAEGDAQASTNELDAGAASNDAGVLDDGGDANTGDGGSQVDAGMADPCANAPCMNGGTCVAHGSSFTCECTEGFTAALCDTLSTDCANNPCLNGSSCNVSTGTLVCDCVPGFVGDTCATNVDDCISNACENGSTCVDGVLGYSCACLDGFDGAHCENNLDDCSVDPCLNGGICTDQVAAYACECLSGYSGANCQTCPAESACDTDKDNCAPNPCLNQGVCTDGVNAYTCACPLGYTGARCELNIDDCTASFCNSGGKCVDGINGFSCDCVSGFTGATCNVNIDDCVSNACENGSTCVDGVNAYACTCKAGYTGTYCETNINDCVTNECKNGSSCVDGIAAYSCACLPGYSGTYCQTNVNECAVSPCMNGATCVDGINSYSCTCKTGYSGTNCETNIDDCSPNPCHNGGSCADGVNAFTCTCAAGFKGTTCDTVKGPCDDHPCSNNGVCIVSDSGSSYQCACPNGFTGALCDTVSAATSCSNLWSSVSTYYSNSVTFQSCDNSESARTIVGSLMNLENESVSINGSTYKPCIDFRCDASYVYVVSTNLPFYDPPSWLPGGKTNPPTTNLIYRIPIAKTSIATPAANNIGDSMSLGASCDDAYQYAVGLAATDVAQEPYGFCLMGGHGTKYFWDGSTYYRRTNCLIGNGFTIDGQTIYGSNEAANGSWGNPVFYYPDSGTSSELYYKSPSTGASRPGLDFCGTHFHHHGINASCYERDSGRAPAHTSYTNADIKGLFNFSQWIYDDICTDESEIVGWMADGVAIKGPCVCMTRDSTGACTQAYSVRSSYVYQGLNSWKGSTSSTSVAATDLATHEAQACTSDSDCGTSGQLECAWSLFSDAGAAQTAVGKRCVALNYAWCSHSYVNRASVSAATAGVVYLDRCNGVTSADGYAYHVTGSFPYVPSCFRYEPSDSATDSTL